MEEAAFGTRRGSIQQRSAIYYIPAPLSKKDMEIMRRIDEIHLMYPFYGSRKIRNELWSKGYDIGRDRVRRLMRKMGVEAPM